MMAIDLHACQVVSTERWNDGKPVRIHAAHQHGGRMAVRWQDARLCGGMHLDLVELGMHVDLVSGGCLHRPTQPALPVVDEATRAVTEGLDNLSRRIGPPATDSEDGATCL
ncbi:hypothetical protein AB0L05_27950 [Nonomuraea pusilla]|uniref:hypothetical protein n=1 Tax=Nonomuraea pusilla TaxID=46177 RepID=UPI00331AFE03